MRCGTLMTVGIGSLFIMNEQYYIYCSVIMTLCSGLIEYGR